MSSNHEEPHYVITQKKKKKNNFIGRYTKQIIFKKEVTLSKPSF